MVIIGSLINSRICSLNQSRIQLLNNKQTFVPAHSFSHSSTSSMIKMSIHSGIGTLMQTKTHTWITYLLIFSCMPPAHSLNKLNFAYLLNVIVLHLLSYLIVHTHSLSTSIMYSFFSFIIHWYKVHYGWMHLFNSLVLKIKGQLPSILT